MTCPTCGTANADGAAFCANCGTGLSSTDGGAVATAAAPGGNGGALPLSVAIAILRYSAAGLAFAHDKKIVHRDIKGANILVDKDGRVMVSDFGIARALEEVSLTASGMVIGTPYYMSPEQCGGQKISPQSDQYSLGIMGFQMLTGEVPFNAESMVGVIQHHYMTPVPDITLVRSDAPKELLDIIYCSLNKAPE